MRHEGKEWLTMFRTLLVEDNEGFRHMLQTMLAENFPTLEVLEAGSGHDAIVAVAALKPHLVFVDIKLPDENGLELTRKIKGLDATIAVVILTSYDLPEYRQAAFRNGASCFMCKESASPGDIVALIQGAMLNEHIH
ncbi:MAG: response regulator [Gammaproteobacteria bacterium HGW-Gammaproteobacteria-1]|jgi:DNA-binding NarL/FixJ family response regulator|nr:MAG: response regulator [Gammaproteobacteria bacterium HGW-Gammaproteobacteria-1]